MIVDGLEVLDNLFLSFDGATIYNYCFQWLIFDGVIGLLGA